MFKDDLVESKILAIVSFLKKKDAEERRRLILSKKKAEESDLEDTRKAEKYLEEVKI